MTRHRSSVTTGAGAGFGCVLGVVCAVLVLVIGGVLLLVGMGSCALVVGSG